MADAAEAENYFSNLLENSQLMNDVVDALLKASYIINKKLRDKDRDCEESVEQMSKETRRNSQYRSRGIYLIWHIGYWLVNKTEPQSLRACRAEIGAKRRLEIDEKYREQITPRRDLYTKSVFEYKKCETPDWSYEMVVSLKKHMATLVRYLIMAIFQYSISLRKDSTKLNDKNSSESDDEAVVNLNDLSLEEALRRVRNSPRNHWNVRRKLYIAMLFELDIPLVLIVFKDIVRRKETAPYAVKELLKVCIDKVYDYTAVRRNDRACLILEATARLQDNIYMDVLKSLIWAAECEYYNQPGAKTVHQEFNMTFLHLNHSSGGFGNYQFDLHPAALCHFHRTARHTSSLHYWATDKHQTFNLATQVTGIGQVHYIYFVDRRKNQQVIFDLTSLDSYPFSYATSWEERLKIARSIFPPDREIIVVKKLDPLDVQFCKFDDFEKGSKNPKRKSVYYIKTGGLGCGTFFVHTVDENDGDGGVKHKSVRCLSRRHKKTKPEDMELSVAAHLGSDSDGVSQSSSDEEDGQSSSALSIREIDEDYQLIEGF